MGRRLLLNNLMTSYNNLAFKFQTDNGDYKHFQIQKPTKPKISQLEKDRRLLQYQWPYVTIKVYNTKATKPTQQDHYV